MYLSFLQELEKLGKGGSGQVVKVRNRPDERFHAALADSLLPFISRRPLVPGYPCR
jgi:hypothetical protein